MDAIEKKNEAIRKNANGILFHTYEAAQWWAQQSNTRFREAFRMFTFNFLFHDLGKSKEFHMRTLILINKFLSTIHDDATGVLLINAFMTEEKAWKDYHTYLGVAVNNPKYLLYKVFNGELNYIEVRGRAIEFYNEFIAFIIDDDRVLIESLTREEKAFILAHRMGKELLTQGYQEDS